MALFLAIISLLSQDEVDFRSSLFTRCVFIYLLFVNDLFDKHYVQRKRRTIYCMPLISGSSHKRSGGCIACALINSTAGTLNQCAQIDPARTQRTVTCHF